MNDENQSKSQQFQILGGQVKEQNQKVRFSSEIRKKNRFCSEELWKNKQISVKNHGKELATFKDYGK